MYQLVPKILCYVVKVSCCIVELQQCHRAAHFYKDQVDLNGMLGWAVWYTKY